MINGTNPLTLKQWFKTTITSNTAKLPQQGGRGAFKCRSNGTMRVEILNRAISLMKATVLQAFIATPLTFSYR